MTVTLEQAQAQLPKLIEQLRTGEEIVITRDQKAGVQVGELGLVTETGFERMHRAERGLFRIE